MLAAAAGTVPDGVAGPTHCTVMVVVGSRCQVRNKVSSCDAAGSTSTLCFFAILGQQRVDAAQRGQPTQGHRDEFAA